MKSAEEYMRLRESEDRLEQLRAVHEELPLEIWLEIIEEFPDARWSVARNKTVPLEVLEILAKDPDERVRWMVVRKRKLTVDILRVLAVDSDETVRADVARHRRADAELLDVLARDHSSYVRGVVAEIRMREK